MEQLEFEFYTAKEYAVARYFGIDVSYATKQIIDMYDRAHKWRHHANQIWASTTGASNIYSTGATYTNYWRPISARGRL
jgi:hypothetical protein